MAAFNGKEGHWITTKDGRHLFIREDLVDKQDREIKARQQETKELNDEKKVQDAASVRDWQPVFKFDWDKVPGNKSANDVMRDHFKKNDIPYYMDNYFRLLADLDKDGTYYVMNEHKGEVVADRAHPYDKNGNEKSTKDVKEGATKQKDDSEDEDVLGRKLSDAQIKQGLKDQLKELLEKNKGKFPPGRLFLGEGKQKIAALEAINEEYTKLSPLEQRVYKLLTVTDGNLHVPYHGKFSTAGLTDSAIEGLKKVWAVKAARSIEAPDSAYPSIDVWEKAQKKGK